MVPSCSNLCLNRGTASLSQDFAGHEAGVTEVMERHRAASGSNSSKNLKDTHYYLLIQLLERSLKPSQSKCKELKTYRTIPEIPICFLLFLSFLGRAPFVADIHRKVRVLAARKGSQVSHH
jgi:hypothetical protein